MSSIFSRRRFLKTVTAASVLAGIEHPGGAWGSDSSGKKRFSRAVIVPPPDEAKMKEVRKAGFDGVEVSLSSRLVEPEQARKARETAEKIGFRIHNVLRGWANFNVPEKAQADFDYTVGAIRAAQAYGADSILLVPGRVGGMEMPAKWGFSVEFDETTGHITRVGDGDPKFDEYMKAHNRAWDAFQEWVPKLIPVAEETGIIVAIENVWSNLFNTPEHFKFLIDSFGSPWIRAYFDVANHISYGRPSEEWIRILGKRIVKVHIKDYRLNPKEGEKEWPDLQEGSVDFPAVIAALEQIDYKGWLTIEGSGGLPYEEQFRRLESIIRSG